MKIFLPKQHGAWVMLIIPFWLGVVEAGFIWQHIPFFVGWLFIYLATYPLLLIFKKKKVTFYSKWAMIYLIPAFGFLMVPFLARPSIAIFGLIMLPFFLVNAHFSAKNNERALLNDFSAVFVFSLAGVASSYIVIGTITNDALLLFSTSALFFIGCTIYVKTMIREKRNAQFKWISWTYHFLLPIIGILIGNWIVAFAFLPSLLRAIYFYGKKFSAKQVGIYEVINSILFFICMVIDNKFIH